MPHALQTDLRAHIRTVRPDTQTTDLAGSTIAGAVVSRPLRERPLGECWLAHRRDDSVPLAAYRIARTAVPGASSGAFVQAMRRLADARLPHALSILAVHAEEGGDWWVLSPYVGSYEGLLSLDMLLARKPGARLTPLETLHAAAQLLTALAAADEAGVFHGPVSLDEILVDRRGSLLIELFGVERLIRGEQGPDVDEARDAVASAVGAIYRLLTGLPPRSLKTAELARQVGPRWVEWLERGLAAHGGFTDASEALAALPGRAPDPPPRTHPAPAQERPKNS